MKNQTFQWNGLNRLINLISSHTRGTKAGCFEQLGPDDECIELLCKSMQVARESNQTNSPPPKRSKIKTLTSFCSFSRRLRSFSSRMACSLAFFLSSSAFRSAIVAAPARQRATPLFLSIDLFWVLCGRPRVLFLPSCQFTRSDAVQFASQVTSLVPG